LTGTKEHLILAYKKQMTEEWKKGRRRRSTADGGDFRVGAAALE
jgi:hypothetical protein